jgi:hypothetical protein
MKNFVLFLLILISAGIVSAQELIIFPASDSIPRNKLYTVKVKTPHGRWENLYNYQAQVDMHNVQNTSMVYFDFKGKVDISITYNGGPVQSARVRPLSYQIHPEIKGNTITFSLDKPCNISVEVNGDIFHNLHVFTNEPETFKPSPADTSVIYFGPGVYTVKNNELKLKDGKTLYLAGGAVLKASINCDHLKNIRICGRGIVYKPIDGVGIKFSDNIKIEDLIFINPQHYTVSSGQSNNITIKNIRSFSSKGWSDGIDLFSNNNVLIEGVFMRNSDDCIAIYAHRWDFYGNCTNVKVQNSSLWADVAHPILIGTHGNPEPGKEETIENINFSNIDILNHDEPQIDYQGCMSINVSDGNLARNIHFENIRIEDFEQGQLVNLRVAYNKKYAQAPGRGIEDVYFKNITYNGTHANLSIIQGYDESKPIKNIVFENLNINGKLISKKTPHPGYYKLSDLARFFVGTHVENLEFITSDEKPVSNGSKQ